MRKLLIALLLFALASCAQVPTVRNREVPSAFFVFFDENSVQSLAGSDAVLDEVSDFLLYYKDLTVNVVGQRAKGETAKSTNGTLDGQRAAFIATELVNRGVEAGRMRVVGQGINESMAAAAGGDESVDRRVDILLLGASAPQ